MIITSPCRAADIDGADILKTGSGETAKPDAALYTGMTLFAYKTETYGTAFLGKYTIVIMGDVNCDGEVKANDARLVLRAAAKLEKLGEYRSLAADWNKNSVITASDARMILRRSAGL